MVLKTFWFESMRGDLEEKLGRGEEVRSESEMREEWRWRFDGWGRERLRDAICRLMVGKKRLI